MRRPSKLERALTHAVLIALCLLTLYPVIWVVDLAFRPGASLQPGLLPSPGEWSLQNIRAVMSTVDAAGNGLFWRQLANSVGVALLTTVLALSVSCTAAYALSRYNFPGRERGLRFFFITQMFPGVVSAVPLYILLDRVGLIDNLFGLVLVYGTTAVPFSVFMLKGFFDQIPIDLEEAARVDGASPQSVFFRIVLPLAKPGLAVTALFSFLTAWNEFVLAATFLNTEVQYTLPVVLQQHIGAYSARWDLFAAGALLVSIPVVALFYALQRHLVGGLMQGGVKG
ncbi:MAG: sugar ABC transporter permease [Planctomycetota bacterium]|jgi:arabinogalactan oligomer/maltooligosaccharide transport system permease protein